MSRRVFFRLALVVAVVTSGLAPASESAAQGGSIKIGMLAPLTGAFSGAGKDMVAGLELYFDEINRQIAGRRVELVIDRLLSNRSFNPSLYRSIFKTLVSILSMNSRMAAERPALSNAFGIILCDTLRTSLQDSSTRLIIFSNFSF